MFFRKKKVTSSQMKSIYISPFPEKAEEEKAEIDKIVQSPSFRQKEQELFVRVCGEEYARKMGLFDDQPE